MPREVAESSDLVQSLKGVVITGSSVLVEGTLVAAPEGKEQARMQPLAATTTPAAAATAPVHTQPAQRPLMCGMQYRSFTTMGCRGPF